MKTVFGKMKIKSPRLRPCCCASYQSKSLSPLTAALPERTTPELLCLETKWAAQVSYQITQRMLQDVLPVDENLNAMTIRNHLLKTAQRVENQLGEERFSYIEGCQLQRDELPSPNGPLIVGIDGGYVRGRDGNCFEAIAGKSILSFRRGEEGNDPSIKCFAFVQNHDDKPKRRLHELLKSQGLQANQQITFLSDGGDDVRNLQRYMSPQAEHLLDWFHLTMRLTVLKQTAKGLPIKLGDGEQEIKLQEPALAALKSIKWYLWHGNVYQALEHLENLQMDLEGAWEFANPPVQKLLKTIGEFHTYISRNRNFIVNYGERYRHGERISTAFVESTVNQVIDKRMSKKQQMRWTPFGAHQLLQVRTKVLNDEWEATFRSWYPQFHPELQKAA
ncbi:MAG: ISKra4 family transposase [Verrucomicrobiae bacterium]|nr:ISKra4 family transposase [Verrucomicrobiae bacterium]